MPEIKIVNPAGTARTSIVTLGVPFSQSDNLQTSDTLLVSNAYTQLSLPQWAQWYPQGARWPNGAVKYARVSFKADTTASQTKLCTVFKDTGVQYTQIPFAYHSDVASQFFGTVVLFSIQGRTFQIPMTQMTLVEGGGGGSGYHYNRFRYWGRHPDLPWIWIEFVADRYSELEYSTFWLRFGNSWIDYYVAGNGNHQYANTVVMQLTSPVTLTISGPGAYLRESEFCVPNISVNGTITTFTLIDPVANQASSHHLFPAGISAAYKGVLTYGTQSSNNNVAEINSQITAIAKNWNLNNVPPFFSIPALPSYITSESVAVSRTNSILNASKTTSGVGRNNPYCWWPLTTNSNTTSTGNQGYLGYGFGAQRGWPWLLANNPAIIPWGEFGIRQLSRRFNWLYESDGTKLNSNEATTEWVVMWNGTFLGTNKLGYSRTLTTSDCPRSTQNVPWYGPDREHETNMMDLIVGLLSMDWYCLTHFDYWIEFWSCSYRTDTRSTTVNNKGPSRAIGRGLQTGASILEYTGSSLVKHWVEQRILKVKQSYYGDAIGGGMENLKYHAENTPTSQSGGLLDSTHWRPWEESEACKGLYACAKVLQAMDPGNTYAVDALRLAREVAGAITLYGFFDNRTTYQIIELENFGSSITTHWAPGRVVTAGSATGTIYFVEDVGTLRLWLHTCTNQFSSGPVTSNAGGSANIRFRGPNFLGCTAKSVGLETGHYGTDTTAAEILVLDGRTTGSLPFGDLKWVRWFSSYFQWQWPALVIAEEAALQGLYSNLNSEIAVKARDILNYIQAFARADNGTFNETFDSWAWLHPNVLGFGSAIFGAETTSIITQAFSPTVTASGSVSATATPNIAAISTTALAAKAETTTVSGDRTVAPGVSRVSCSQQEPEMNSGIVNAAVTISDPVSIGSSITSATPLIIPSGPSRRVYKIIYTNIAGAAGDNDTSMGLPRDNPADLPNFGKGDDSDNAPQDFDTEEYLTQVSEVTLEERVFD